MAVTPRSKRPLRRSDPKTLARGVEELSWLLSSYEELDFKALGNMSSELVAFSRSSSELATRSQRPPAVRLLVGVLPNFLTETDLFPSNEDIVEFAEAALGINITRWQKRSRYELIGNIVVHINEASRAKVERLMGVLELALDDRGSTKRRMKSDRELGRSWNEVIQSLVRDNDQ